MLDAAGGRSRSQPRAARPSQSPARASSPTHLSSRSSQLLTPFKFNQPTHQPSRQSLLCPRQEADLEELIRQKEELAAERDTQVETIMTLRNEVSLQGVTSGQAAG